MANFNEFMSDMRGGRPGGFSGGGSSFMAQMRQRAQNMGNPMPDFMRDQRPGGPINTLPMPGMGGQPPGGPITTLPFPPPQPGSFNGGMPVPPQYPGGPNGMGGQGLVGLGQGLVGLSQMPAQYMGGLPGAMPPPPGMGGAPVPEPGGQHARRAEA